MAFFREGRLPRLLFAQRQEYGENIISRTVHRHDDCTEINFIRRGVGEYTVNDQIYEVGPGDVLLYNQGDLHELSTTAGCQIGAYCFGVAELSLEGLPDGHMSIPENGFVRPAKGMRAELASLCKLIYDMSQSREPNSRAAMQHLFAAFIQIAVDLPADERAQQQSAEVLLAARIRQYIGLHFQESLTLEEIGAAVGISPYYAAHVFKDVFHTSPIQYMIRCRVGAAQNLLISSDFSATQIAAMVGYSSANHFNAIFAKTVGLTPIRYRKWYLESMHGKRAQ